MDKTAIVIVGPTAVGKTALSVALAGRLHAEIVNGDAFQVYRGMNIGTAKVTADEAAGVPHHLIDIRDPDQAYTAADYQCDARRAMEEISTRGHMPMIVGGTGFYIKAALYNYQFGSVSANHAYRQKLAAQAQEEGSEALHARLQAVDPVAAARIHPHNLVRIMRALEVVHETGKPFSAQPEGTADTPRYRHLCIGLTMERERLYARINARVDQMMADGLLEEVRLLYEKGLRDTQAMQAIGYKEFIPYFDGMSTLEAAIIQLKKNSRHYAKRQLTWFKHQMPVHWFDVGDPQRDIQKTEEAIYRFVLPAVSDGHSL